VADPLCLIVTNNFPPVIGGAGAVYAALARAGAGRVHVLAAATDYRAGGEIAGWRAHDAACGFPVRRIAALRPPLAGMGRGAELWLRLRVFARVAAEVWRWRFPVLVIADDETVGWLIRPAQWLLRRRVVLYTHGDDLALRPGEARLRARRARQFARADAVIAVSGAAAEDLARGFGVERARIRVLANGIDTGLFRPAPADAGLRAALGLTGRRVVITVARLVARKGVDRVLEAVALLRPEFPDLAYLVVGDGPERAALEARAARADLAGAVRFAGAVPAEEVPRYLALAEVFVMANRRLDDGEDEGFGLVFLEAGACGKPVIAGRAGGAVEVVREGETGLLVDGADPADIARALRRVLSDPALAARLAEAGLAHARAADWRARAGAFLELCEELR
jgi:phosphatidylinositol alpha-1,6-mannosyltransferase